MDVQQFLENRASVDFLDILHKLAEEIDRIVRKEGLTRAEIWRVIASYFYEGDAPITIYYDDELAHEPLSPETLRQIADLREAWGEDAVLWRCVERAWSSIPTR